MKDLKLYKLAASLFLCNFLQFHFSGACAISVTSGKPSTNQPSFFPFSLNFKNLKSVPHNISSEICDYVKLRMQNPLIASTRGYFCLISNGIQKLVVRFLAINTRFLEDFSFFWLAYKHH